MHEILLRSIVYDIHHQSEVSPSYFGDEVTDASNSEQLAIIIRYLKKGIPTEKLLEFIECDSTTGSAICDNIIGFLKKFNISPELCRAQTYDGAGNMAGHLNGCSALFKRKFPRATYYHCASHDLNLALSKTARITEVNCMLSTLVTIGIFFKYSPKRQKIVWKNALLSIIEV